MLASSCIRHVKLTCKNSLKICQISARNLSHGDIEAEDILNKLHSIIRAQRFSQIVVIQTKFNADPRYLVLANAFSSRHLISGTEAINKQYKNTIRQPDQDFASLSLSDEWNVMDFKAVVVHLFSKKCREHFDIEQLWTVGEEFDDIVGASCKV